MAYWRAFGGWCLLAAVSWGPGAVLFAQTASEAPIQEGAEAKPAGDGEAESREGTARHLAAPARPQTFRLQRGIRSWDRDGQQRLRDARRRLWSESQSIRERQEAARGTLRPAGEVSGQDGN